MRTLEYRNPEHRTTDTYKETVLQGRDVGLHHLWLRVRDTYCPFTNAYCRRDCLCYEEDEHMAGFSAYCNHPLHAYRDGGEGYEEIATEYYTPQDKLTIIGER